MTPQNKVLIVSLVRAMPRILLAICLQGIGGIAVVFLGSLLFPGLKGLPGLFGIAFTVWSSRKVNKYITGNGIRQIVSKKKTS